MDERCNGRTECLDKSDEFDCRTVSVDKSYIKDMPAPPQYWDELTKITVSIDLISIMEISEVNSSIEFQFQIYLTWLDPRLTFQNLKREKFLNTMSSSDKSKIWLPQVVFFNNPSKLESANDEQAFVTISRNGERIESPLNNLENVHSYQGSENSLTVSRFYSLPFICNFKMNMYPFDTQTCKIQLTTNGNSDKFVALEKAVLQYLGPVDLTKYFVKEWSFEESKLTDNVNGLEISIILGRRILSEILTTYLPTVLLCVVSFSTNYFNQFYFEAIVTVNLTSLLVLTNIFINVSNALPKTAYIKMIDVWLLFCLCIPFCEVILHTIIDRLRPHKDRQINNHGSRIKIPQKKNITGSRKNSLLMNGRKIIQIGEKKVRPEVFSAGGFSAVKQKTGSWNQESILDFCYLFMSVGLPTIFVTFSVVYSCLGAYYYNQ